MIQVPIWLNIDPYLTLISININPHLSNPNQNPHLSNRTKAVTAATPPSCLRYEDSDGNRWNGWNGWNGCQETLIEFLHQFIFGIKNNKVI